MKRKDSVPQDQDHYKTFFLTYFIHASPHEDLANTFLNTINPSIPNLTQKKGSKLCINIQVEITQIQ